LEAHTHEYGMKEIEIEKESKNEIGTKKEETETKGDR
jgi:hypothetical protein